MLARILSHTLRLAFAFSLPVHSARQIRLGHVAAFVFIDAADLFHAGQVVGHGLLALAYQS